MENKMFNYFAGTKEQFITKGYPETYADKIVFIKGGGDASKSCIFAQGMYFANFAELLAAINFVKGVKVGDNTYNAATGGGYVAFKSVDPSTLTLDVEKGELQFGLTTAFVNKVNNTATNLGTSTDAANSTGSAFARIANLAAIVGQLTGSEGGDLESVEGQITKAIDALRTEITGDLLDTTDAKTIEAINDELNGLDAKVKAIEDAGYITLADVNEVIDNLGGSASSENGKHIIVTVTTEKGEVKSVSVNNAGLETALGNKANLVNGKIRTEELPDYILGQVMFGGIIKGGISTSISIEVTEDFKSKYPGISVNSNNLVTIVPGEASQFEGTYFISNATIASFDGVEDIVPGDWLISTGSAWAKVDNSDAVTSVAGLTGNVDTSALAGALSNSEVSGALATKSEVTNVKVTAEGDELISASHDADGRKITVQATEALTNAVNNANSAYQKPTDGIPATDLTTDAQTKLTRGGRAITSINFKSTGVVNSTSFIQIEDGTPTGAPAGTKSFAVVMTEGDFADPTTSDGLAKVSDIKAYVDSLWEWGELE